MMVRNDIINKILAKESLTHFTLCKNKKILILYLITKCGYLEKKKQFFSLTELGKIFL